MILYFWFLIVFAGNWPGVGFPRWIVRERSSLAPQHRLHNEQKQLQQLNVCSGVTKGRRGTFI